MNPKGDFTPKVIDTLIRELRLGLDRPNRVVTAIAAIVAMLSLAIMLNAADWRVPGPLLVVMFVTLTVLPYAFAVLLTALPTYRGFFRRWAFSIVVSYGGFELWSRYQTLGGSGDEMAYTILEVSTLWAGVFYVSSGLLISIWTWITGGFGESR